jgi:hypothetical protein
MVKELRCMFRGGSHKDNFDESLTFVSWLVKKLDFSQIVDFLYTLHRGLAYGFLSHNWEGREGCMGLISISTFVLLK